jgi:hypothetical protein
VSLARQFDDPLPADVRDLDLITFLFSAAPRPRLRPLADIGGILTVDHAGRGDCARHQFRAVTPARAHIAWSRREV